MSTTAARGVLPLVDTTALDGPIHDRETVRAAHRMYEHLVSLWAPAIIEAAHDLGVFTELARGPADAGELAKSLGTDERATRVLLDALYAYQVVDRTDAGSIHGVYSLPADLAGCLTPGNSFNLTGKVLHDRNVAWDAWRNLDLRVRTGTSGGSGEERGNQISTADYQALAAGINFWAPPIVARLREGLAALGWPSGKPVRLLDVGCGTGIYSHLLLRAEPAWTALGLDAQPIIDIALEQAADLGVSARFSGVARDFQRDPWGGDFDLALFVNIFHLQTPPAAQGLLRKAARSLAPGGLVCIADNIVVDEPDAPVTAQDRFAMLFAASMLATGGGDTYRLSQYDEWFAAAGLRRVSTVDTPMHRLVLAARDGAGSGAVDR